jgi:hypothetical protein
MWTLFPYTTLFRSAKRTIALLTVGCVPPMKFICSSPYLDALRSALIRT